MSSSGPNKPILKMPVLAPAKLGFGQNNKSLEASSNNQSQFKTSFVMKKSKLSGVASTLATSSQPPTSELAKVSECKPPPEVGFIPLSNNDPLTTPPKKSGEVDAEDNNGSSRVVQQPLPTSSEQKITTEEPHKDPEPAGGGESDQQQQQQEEVFVFGQNLVERAANFDAKKEEEKKKSSPAKQSDAGADSEAPKKTLTESAAEYCESHSQKRKYEEVKPITGEEDETNVVQMSAKLHMFDKNTSSWIERGRGTLRLNDVRSEDSKISSRLVMRATGVHRVIMNTPIFSGMSLETPTEKTIRLTGTDEGQAKIYLITAAQRDISELHRALQKRKDEATSETGEPPQKKSSADSP